MAAYDLARFGELVSLHAHDGTIVDITPAFAELLGYPVHELVGRSGWDFAPEANDERRARVHGTLDASGALSDVATWRRGDGTFLRVAYVARVLDDEHVVSVAEPIAPDGFVGLVDDAAAGARAAVARRQAEAAHARSRDAIRVALELAGTPGRWVDMAGAVAYSGMSESTIERAVDAGALPRGGTVGKRMFHTAWLDEWLAGGTLAVLLVLALLGLAIACACGDETACHLLHELGLRAHGSRG